MPRPRRNSSRPSSRSSRRERRTVFVLTPSTAARSLAGGSRSPGLASPSAMARRISAATCSCRSRALSRASLTCRMVLVTIASSDDVVVTVTTPRRPEIDPDRDLEQRVADLEALIEEARRRARRRRQRNGAAAVLFAAAGAAAFIGFGGRGGGGGSGSAALAGGSGASSQATNQAPPLAALPAGNRAFVFAFDPLRPTIVYVASPHARGGVYVYKTTDEGEHWHSTGAQGAGWISDILSLTADPRRPGTLYAGTDTAVYKTVNGGRTWRPINQGLFPPWDSICSGAAVISGCHRLPSGPGAPGTTGWNRNNGWVLDVAVDPVHSNVVYAAAGGVRKSNDGGHTWKPVFIPTRWRDGGVSRIAIAPTRPESVYAIAHDLHTGATAIYKSTDAGRTWKVTGGSASSLPPSCCWDSMDALAVDSQDPQTLYAAVGSRVFVTTDGGASWQSMSNGLPTNGVTSLAADTRRSGTVYASMETSHTYKTKAGDVEKPTGAIYKTTDGGKTWSGIFSGRFGVERVAVDPARPSTLYAAGWAGRDPTHPNAFRLLRSMDGGHSWTVAD